MLFIKIAPCKVFFHRSKVLNFANLALLYPIFFPTIKSWGNGLSIIVLAVALITIFSNRRQYFLSRSKLFWLLFVTLISPFFLELIVQVCRGPFTWNALDGPSRFLIGGVIFLYLSKHQDIDSVVMSFSLGCLICIPVTLIYVLAFKEFYWSNRCATSLLCPNALPVYVTYFGISSYNYIHNTDYSKFIKYTICFAVILMVLYVVLICESRTVWLCILILLILSSCVFYWNKKKKVLLAISAIFIGAIISYLLSNTVKERMDIASESITKIFTHPDQSNSYHNTSLGIRFCLFTLELHLVSKNLLFGTADSVTPPFDEVVKHLSFLPEIAHRILSNSGSHCEFTAHLRRKGVIFGSFALISLFIVPLLILLRAICINHIYKFNVPSLFAV